MNSIKVVKIIISKIFNKIDISKKYIKYRNTDVTPYICAFIKRGFINFLALNDLYPNSKPSPIIIPII